MATRLKSAQRLAGQFTSQLFFAVLLVSLVGFVGFFLFHSLQIQQKQTEREQKAIELKAAQAQVDSLQEHLDFYKGPGYQLYVEKVAREALGLVKPGETVVIPQVDASIQPVAVQSGAERAAEKARQAQAGKTNWQKWLEFFTGPSN